MARTKGGIKTEIHYLKQERKDCNRRIKMLNDRIKLLEESLLKKHERSN